MTTEESLESTLDTGSGTRRQLVVGEYAFETGGFLPEVELAYETWGRLDSGASNAVLVTHALTGDAHVSRGDSDYDGWWEDFVGPGKAIDTEKYFVVAVNIIGGCNGSTGPGSADANGVAWGSRFPFTTIKDSVHLETRLADALGIEAWHTVIGGSMGGARALEWAVLYPQRVRNLVVMAACAQATAEQIGFAQVQSQSIRLDPHFAGGDYYGTGHAPDAGLGVARRLAHLTYRSEAELQARFGRAGQRTEDPLGAASWPRGRYMVESYLDHQAAKLTRRFDANSYLVLTEALMSHDVARGFESLEHALGRLANVNTVIAAVSSDRLYFPEQSEQLAALIPGAGPVCYIDSPIGHDGFLTDANQLAGVLSQRVFTD
ncbi:homoserine O-acetyltransferase [Glutamicibacter sp. MNS18]|nr:homoserine O-acetyltransferase [Glutamicibacter sp. MNS18]MCW4465187.1 homoserine O-acetyltransferase [Glutamicibacter sp. MNS18]